MNDAYLRQARPTSRLFIALPFPPKAKLELASVQRQLVDATEKQRDKLRLTPTHQFHLTLAFLGNVQQELFESIFRVVDAVASSASPCVLVPKALLALPSPSRARVVALSFDEPSGHLESVVAALHARLRERGHQLDDRAFLAHVTVARLARAQRSPLILNGVRNEISPVLAQKVAVYRSELMSSGAVHHRLFSRRLGTALSVR